MPMYVVLGRLTEQGAKNIKDWPTWGRENRAHAERLGIKVHGAYVTQGQYDFVIVAEAPDEQTMLAQAFSVASRGNSRTETLLAIPLDEIQQQVIQKLG